MSPPKEIEVGSTTTLIPTKDSPYIKSGIGGVGNFRKVSEALPVQPKPDTFGRGNGSGIFFTGIGGLGNCHKDEERPITSHDEMHALRAIEKENRSTTWHRGIGGMGNLASTSTVSLDFVETGYSFPLIASRSGADKMKDMIVRLFRGKTKRNNSVV